MSNPIVEDNILQASRYLLQAAKLRYRNELNALRPSVVMQATLSEHLDREGEKYYLAEYDGLIVAGDTPNDAFDNFDAAWQGVES